MKTLLRIDSSPRAERSHSRQLTAQYTQAWQEAHPDGKVIHRDLGLAPVPLVTEAWIAAAFSNPADHTPEQQAAIAPSNELVDELLAADKLLIGAPMYNFTVPASLKAWIDQVVRVGRTFSYPDFQGLTTGKTATIITVRGGPGYGPGEAMAHMDAEVPYLRLILGFIGITEVSVVYAGNLAGSDELRQVSLDKALTEIKGLAAR